MPTTTKRVVFENMRNRERFYCTDVRNIQKIDGIEFLRVFRESTQQECLIRRDLLKKIPATK